MTRVGVLLCGSGHRDGSEIHEAVLTMLALEEEGATLHCLALAKPQAAVYDHLTGKLAPGESRVMITEAARIARGKIRDAAIVTPDELDALVIPGGSGLAANLCDYAARGAEMTVDPDVEHLIRSLHEARKPIGAVCIAPVLLGKVLGKVGVKLTLGNDLKAASDLESWGARSVECDPAHCVVDETHLVVSTPAYMLGEQIAAIYPGIRALAREIVRLAKAQLS
jgi:enhancing lycopene biosynthesis protein 2